MSHYLSLIILPPLSLSLSLSLSSRLHSNNLHCDCHLSWLSDWLRQRRGLAPFTQCMAPAHMRGLNVPDVQKREFVCTGMDGKLFTFSVRMSFSCLLTKIYYYKLHLAYFARKLSLVLVPYLFICLFMHLTLFTLILISNQSFLLFYFFH